MMINGYDLGITNLTRWHSSARSDGRWAIGGSPFGQQQTTTEAEIAALQKEAYVETIKQIRFQRKMSIVTAVGVSIFAVASVVGIVRGR